MYEYSAKIISVDIDKYELNKKRGLNVYLKINQDLKNFLSIFNLKSANFRYSASSKYFEIIKSVGINSCLYDK